MIKDGKLELAASYILTYENSQNRFHVKRAAIARFLEDNVAIYIDATHSVQEHPLLPEFNKPALRPWTPCIPLVPLSHTATIC